MEVDVRSMVQELAENVVSSGWNQVFHGVFVNFEGLASYQSIDYLFESVALFPGS